MSETTIEIISEDDIMNTGAKIVWTLRQLNEGLKQEGFPLMDDIIEQVQTLVEQTGHLGDRIHEYTDRIAHLEYQITEAHQQNETLQSEMRLAREERDELLGEVEGNWEKDVLHLRTQAEAGARERTQLAVHLAESKQDLELLKAEKKELEDSLKKYQVDLMEREQMVWCLREQLQLFEESNDPGKDDCDASQETCQTADFGVDTSDLRKVRHNKTMEERFRSDELLMDLEILGRKCKKLESDKDELEARLKSENNQSSPETSPFHRIGFKRSRSLQEELLGDTSFDHSSLLGPGGDAATSLTPALSHPVCNPDESFYSECETRVDASVGCQLDEICGVGAWLVDGSPKVKEKEGKMFRWTDVVMCCLLCLVLDVVYFSVYGQHLFTWTRIDRRHNRNAAIF